MTDHTSNTPAASKDYWSTPRWLYDWLDSIFHFEIDLAANADNAKHEIFYSEEDDAHHQHWNDYGRKRGFLNPPYSNISPWIDDSIDMQQVGFTTVSVIPTHNGESYYKNVLQYASEIIFINGRIAFVASCDFTIDGKNGKPDRHIKKGDEVLGNTRGTCVAVFGVLGGPPRITHVDRDDIRAEFE